MIDTIDHDRVRELRLARPPANAINPALIEALRAALAEAVRAGRGAIVLSGAPGLFSGGLDLPEILALPPPALRRMWEQFFGLMRDIAAAPIPVIAALTGHSPAGGTVLALYADHRIMAQGTFKLGLNEVQVGLPVPVALVRALAYVVGARQAARLATAGLLLASHEALQVGLVDELVPVDDVVPRALAFAADLLTRPPTAMLTTRRIAREPLVRTFDALDDAAIDAMVTAWATPEAQATLQAIAARLGKRPR